MSAAVGKPVHSAVDRQKPTENPEESPGKSDRKATENDGLDQIEV